MGLYGTERTADRNPGPLVSRYIRSRSGKRELMSKKRINKNVINYSIIAVVFLVCIVYMLSLIHI